MAEGFAAIPTWMIRDVEKVSGYAIAVYGVLASRSGYRSVFPGQTLIAAEARCSERKVRDALVELEQLGVVERVKRGAAGGGRRTDAYRLMDRPLGEDEETNPAHDAGNGEFPAPAERVSGTSEQSSPYIEIDRAEIDKAASTAQSKHSASELALVESRDLLAAAFQAFYSAYPRKVGREGAERAFAKAAKRTGSFQVIIDGARRLAADPNLPSGKDRNFIPHPTTWLNQGRWDDEPLPPRAGAASGTAVERMAARLRDGHQQPEDGEQRALRA